MDHSRTAGMLVAILAAGSPAAQQDDFVATGKRWIDMNYGQYLTTAIEVGEGNIAYKGIAIRVDGANDGITRGREFVVFDTDTLRVAAGWHGSQFIDWKSIVFDGSHGTHPTLVGAKVFENAPGPGWAKPGTSSFADERIVGTDGRRYGPLAREWARFDGLYVNGSKTILSYTVGTTKVLEMPIAMTAGDSRLLGRVMDVGPRAADLLLRVAHDARVQPSIRGKLVVHAPAAEAVAPATARTLVFGGDRCYEVAGSDGIDLTAKPFTIWARIRTRENGTILAKAPREGNWAEDGKTFFVRGGRLCYDIGWVGVVRSGRRVNDGEWHEVAVTFAPDDGVLRLFVDGRLEGEGKLAPKNPVADHVVRIGYTSPDFPEPSAFAGSIGDVRVYQRRFSVEALGALAERVGADDGLVGRWVAGAAGSEQLADRSGHGRDARQVGVGGALGDAPESGSIGITGLIGDGDLRWEPQADGSLALRVAAGGEPVRFAIVHGRAVEPRAIDAVSELVRTADTPGALAPLTARGGPRRWAETVTTKRSTLGVPGGPFAVDVIPTPDENPYRSWMRLGGFDFYPGGKRAAVCTWMGDVWTVDGLDGEEFTWARVATGLYQPLGLVLKGEDIYVLGRDQITRLHDTNGDGETDFYECFNNDAQVTEHFHEFAMDLQVGADGSFYYTKGGRHAKDCVVPQHGTLLRVSPDGGRTEYVAHGFRAPNGLCVVGDGSFVISDQEGHWTPANRINWVEPGGFYGYMWSYHRGERPTMYDKPLCWVDHDIDRSPAQQLIVRNRDWGVLDGKLLSLSYGTGHVSLVLREEVSGQRQGAITRMPLPVFPTGIMRGRFHPTDGQLYLCGLFGWSSNRTAPGGLFRIRRTEAPLCVPVATHATERGVVLRFSEPLDVRRAAAPGRYKVTRWNYKWQQRYGSDDFRVSDGEKGRETVEVTAVRMSVDGRAVLLEIEDMRSCHQMKIEYRLASATGTRLSEPLYLTIHGLSTADAHLDGFGR